MLYGTEQTISFISQMLTGECLAVKFTPTFFLLFYIFIVICSFFNVAAAAEINSALYILCSIYSGERSSKVQQSTEQSSDIP